MRVYWLEGELHMKPDSSEEIVALQTLVGALSTGRPPDRSETIPGGSTH